MWVRVCFDPYKGQTSGKRTPTPKHTPKTRTQKSRSERRITLTMRVKLILKALGYTVAIFIGACIFAMI